MRSRLLGGAAASSARALPRRHMVRRAACLGCVCVPCAASAHMLVRVALCRVMYVSACAGVWRACHFDAVARADLSLDAAQRAIVTVKAKDID